MKNRIGILLIWLCVFFPNIMSGQDISVKTSLDTNKILIGDQIHYRIQVRKPTDLQVAFPGPGENFPSRIEILEEEATDTSVLNDNELLIEKKYLVTVFDTGSFTIPALKFKYGTASLDDSIFSDSTFLTVYPVKVDTTDNIFTVKSPFGAPVTFKEALPYIGIGLGVVFLVLLTLYLMRKFKRKDELVEPEKPSEPAHVIAFRDLDKLKKQKLWQEGEIKLYYTRLSDILRTYLWLRYDIKTLERTTEEILTSLKNTGFDNDELFNLLQETLQLADLVKFAKFDPNQKAHQESMESAYRFVNETKMAEEEKKPDTDKEGNKEDHMEVAENSNKEGGER